MSINVHFHTNVVDEASAEELLLGKGPGRYVTWRKNDSNFVLSYNSATDNKPVHTPVLRLPDGSFRFERGLDGRAYPTLGDLIATRAYLRSADGADSHTTAATADLRIRRAVDTGGSSALPTSLLPPLARGPSGEVDSDYEEEDKLILRGIRPTCSATAQRAIFTTVMGLSGLLTAGLGYAWARYDEAVTSSFSGIAAASQRAVDGATSQLFARLRTARDGSIAGADEDALDAAVNGDGFGMVAKAHSSGVDRASLLTDAQLASECGAAVNAWQAQLSADADRLQISFEASSGASYIASLVWILVAASLLGIVLLCVHTGRPTERMPTNEEEFAASTGADSSAATSTSAVAASSAVAAAPSAGAGGSEKKKKKQKGKDKEDEADAGEGAAPQKKPRKPACQPMQLRWTAAFTAMLVPLLASGWLLYSTLWVLGDAAGAVEYAAKPLSLRHPVQQVPSGSTRFPGVAEELGIQLEAEGEAGIDRYVWTRGLWGAVVSHLHVPQVCVSAMQAAVDPLLQSPPLLRMPLATLLPWPLSLAAASLKPAVDRSTDSVFSVIDPLPSGRLAGFLDLGGWSAVVDSAPHLLVPSRTGVAHITVTTMAALLMTAVGMLMIQDFALTNWAPKWRRYWKDRARVKARAAARAAATGPAITTAPAAAAHARSD